MKIYKHNANFRGAIPLVMIIAIAIVSLVLGAGVLAFLADKVKLAITMFLVGILLGLFVLPNLPKILKWFKDVRKNL